MRRIIPLLITGGMLACLLGMSLLLMASPAQAQSLPERPTLTPVVPSKKESAPLATARITGTVLDARTNAPAPGITVQVGDVSVVSDANGNYDRNGLVAGSYDIALILSAEHGTAEQGTITINLEEGATVVQHLWFRSPTPPAEPAPAPIPATLPVTSGSDAGGMLLVLGLGMLVAAGVLRRKV